MPVLAVDLGGTKIAAAVVDSRGAIRNRIEEQVEKSDPIAQIARMAEGKEFEAVGVAVPGLVRRDGTVWAPNLPAWESIPLAKLLKKQLRVPVFVESDRNATVLGEAWRGAARGKKDVIALMQRVRQPFNVNAPAQWAALAALADSEHVQRSLETNQQGMK